MNQPPTATVGTWRVLPVAPELRYLSPAAVRQRTRSGFGVASLLLGVTAAVGVAVMWSNIGELSGGDTDFVALVAAPVCVVGFALGVVGVVRRGKRRIHGMLGILIHICVALAAALLWFVTHGVGLTQPRRRRRNLSSASASNHATCTTLTGLTYRRRL